MGVILFGLSGMLFLTYLIVVYKEHRDKRLEKEHQIEELKHVEIVNKQTSNNLSEVFESALDIYDRQGIRIPIDIIEDLQHDTFHSKDEAIQMIEIQRNNWKLENNKKVVK